MRLLTRDERNEYNHTLSRIRSHAVIATHKFMYREITKKKLTEKINKAKEDEAKFIKESGVIFYFGKLFKV